MSRPRLLLLDEPSLGLAPLIAEQIFAAIAKLNDEREAHRVPGRAERLSCAEARASRLCDGQRRDHHDRQRPRTARRGRRCRPPISKAGGSERASDGAIVMPSPDDAATGSGIFLLRHRDLGGGAAFLTGRAIAGDLAAVVARRRLTCCCSAPPCASCISRCSRQRCCRCPIIWSTTAVCLVFGFWASG